MSWCGSLCADDFASRFSGISEAIWLALASYQYDILDYHSSVEDTAKTAARTGVKTLKLTHYAPAMQNGREAGWLPLATTNSTGKIVLSPDLTLLPLHLQQLHFF